MTTSITACRSYLEREYRLRLGLKQGFASQITRDSPAWISISPTTLGRASEPSGAQAAALADPEIGVLAYIIEYRSPGRIAPVITNALRIRSRLLLSKGHPASAPRDPLGSWRVSVYWLADTAPDSATWEDEVAALRREAPHTEEISIDLIRRDSTDWDTALSQHAFPRLLLRTRQALRITTKHDIYQWSTADALVDRTLGDFASRFSNDDQRILAVLVENKLRELKDSNHEQSTSAPAEILSAPLPRSLGVRGFRNIRDLSLELATTSVSCSVICGPNGSGKSSLFEAISIATFGTSHRYYRYFHDRDIGTSPTSADYIGTYLTCITPVDSAPRPELRTGDSWAPPALPDNTDELEALNSLSSSCLLPQDVAASFAERTAPDLAAEVLAGYSDRANQVQWYVEDEYQKANKGRQELLRSLGLRTNITRINTAHRQVIDRELRRLEAKWPDALTAWLEQATTSYSDFVTMTSGTLAAWDTWRKQTSSLIEMCAKDPTSDNIKPHISTWLQRYNQAVDASTALTSGDLAPLLTELTIRGRSLVDDIAKWGHWLEQAQSITDPPSRADVTKLRDRLASLAARQATASSNLALARLHLSHVSRVQVELANSWSTDHDDNCPTCSSNLRDSGGFRTALNTTVNFATKEVARLGEDFQSLSSEIADVGEQLRRLGVADNPINSDTQELLVRALGPICPKGTPLVELLADSGSRARLLGFVNHLLSRPNFPLAVDAGLISASAAKSIGSECLRVSDIFYLPSNWSAVRKVMTNILGDIVLDHLPQTLEGLWAEIALNITSAPWLLSRRPTMHVNSRRSMQSLTIRMGSNSDSPLARHILNQAEINVLGLSWFFVRYITTGRFLKPIMVLDDPAQQMDQTTFRDFCRLVESIVRITRKSQEHLSVVLLFHQEDRAFDAARALNAQLSLLSWTDNQSNASISRLDLIGDAQPILPSVLLN